MLAAVEGEAASILLAVAVIFVAAKLGGEIAARLGTAPLLGEIGAGALLGPHALGVILEGPVVLALADLGVIVLLFAVGLDTNFDRLRAVGGRGVLVGAAGIVLPFLAGAALMLAIGHTTLEALFVGTALVATSVGITARVLAELGLLGETESLIILAAAVADDVLGLILLAAVTSMGTGAFDPLELALLVVATVLFIGILLTAGRVVVRRAESRVRYLRIPHGALSFALVIMLGLAILANVIGLAAIVGAFLAGLLIAELSDEFELKRDVDTLAALLVPFFFVMIGVRFDLSVLGDPGTLLLGAAITGIAIVTKLVGCGLAMIGTSLRSAIRVGVGMVPRGEVGLVVVGIGFTAGIVEGSLYGAIVMMVAATTIVAPALIGPVFGAPRGPRRPAADGP